MSDVPEPYEPYWDYMARRYREEEEKKVAECLKDSNSRTEEEQ
jgi:hypothetical protein